MRDTSLMQLALGLTPPWTVARADFDRSAQRIDIHIDFPPGSRFACPACGAVCPVHDTEQKYYRSLFVAKDVPLSGIVKARFAAGFSSFKPHQRLVLMIQEQRGEREITINLGLFDRAGIRRWADALNARLS